MRKVSAFDGVGSATHANTGWYRNSLRLETNNRATSRPEPIAGLAPFQSNEWWLVEAQVFAADTWRAVLPNPTPIESASLCVSKPRTAPLSHTKAQSPTPAPFRHEKALLLLEYFTHR